MQCPMPSTTKRLRSPATTIAFMALMALSGCSDDDDTVRPPAREDPRKTIAGAMQELIDAYEARDIDRYSALFDQDSFVFVFDPIEVNDPYTDLPSNWNWIEEQSANRNMFQAPTVERIQLTFILGTPEPATEQDAEEPFPQGTMKVQVSEVNLLVDTRDPAGGENLRYIADGDHAIFFLYPDQNEIVDGVPIWKIFEWHDLTIGAPAPTIENSWGGIKYIFR